MKSIWKYSWDESQAQFDMPKGSTILSVGTQRDQMCLWVLVNVEEKITVKRKFFVFGTGQNVPDDEMAQFDFLGRVTIGIYEWHIFERRELHG